MGMSEKHFKFNIPVELLKSDSEDEQEWKIQGIASTDDEDLQGETIDQDGLDISMLKAGRGLFNVDHMKGPENVIGQIEDAEFVHENGKRQLLVKGYLFKHQERAKAFYNILKSLKKANGPRVHMSIEGKIIQRDFVNNKAIKKARIDQVAITLQPVNPYTYAELVKSLNSPEPLETKEQIETPSDEISIKKSDLQMILDFANKALAAGAGYAGAPESMTGGSALTTESLEKEPKVVTYPVKKKKHKRPVISLIKSLCEAHPNEDPLKLVELVLETFIEKLED